MYAATKGDIKHSFNMVTEVIDAANVSDITARMDLSCTYKKQKQKQNTMVIILALAMTQAWATVLVIHGPYPNLVKCQSSRGEQDLSKLSDGVYAACTLDSSFVYCADDECEVVSRTPDDLNHVFGKTQAELSLNLPAIPVVNPMLYFNESARPPTSELFDDQRVASILFSAHGNFSPDYTECTISVVTSHLAYVGLRGKCKWGGGISSLFSPHGFHLNPSGNIGGYNKIYIKKSLFDDSFAIEKLGHDIVQAFGVSDFRASYALAQHVTRSYIGLP